MEKVRHPDHPGLWLNKSRINVTDADGYDDFGDPWWYCSIHAQWWNGYCTGCHPIMDRSVKIGSGIIASAIIVGLVFLLSKAIPW